MATQFSGYRPSVGKKLYKDDSNLNGRLQYVNDNSYTVACSKIISAADVKYGQLVWFGSKKDNVVYGLATDIPQPTNGEAVTIPAVVAYSAGDSSIFPVQGGVVTDLSRVKLILDGYVEYSSGITGLEYENAKLGNLVGYAAVGTGIIMGATTAEVAHPIGKVVSVNPDDKTFVVKFSL